MVDLKLGIFLGAGSSVPYGNPTTRQLKDQLLVKYQYDENVGITPAHYYLESIIKFGKFDNIEHVLQCVKEIDDFFSKSEFGAKYLLEREYKLVFTDPRRPWQLNDLTNNINEIRTMLEDDVFENYSWKHSLDSTLDKIFGILLDMVKKHSKEVRVFTTNYDRAIEVYCGKKERNYRCVDGFSFDQFIRRNLWDGRYDYPPVEGTTNLYLYKLHGSLNWKRHKEYGIEATSEERQSADPNYIENLLVYPTVSPKDGEDIEPYETIRENFKRFMETADIAIVIGYSFRDEHINTVFTNFLERGKIIVVSPSADKTVYTNFLKKDMPEPEAQISEKDSDLVCLIREDKKVFTINKPLTLESSTGITNIISKAITFES